jgi:hypothetical protein
MKRSDDQWDVGEGSESLSKRFVSESIWTTDGLVTKEFWIACNNIADGRNNSNKT